MTTVLENPDSIFYNLTPVEALYMIRKIREEVLPDVTELSSLLRDLDISPITRINAFFGFSGSCRYSRGVIQKFKQRFEKCGYEAEEVLIDIGEVITTKEFIEYAPMQRWPYGEINRRYYRIIYEVAQKVEVTEMILDAAHFKVEKQRLKFSAGRISELYIHGYIGHDGTYLDRKIQRNSIKHIFIPTIEEPVSVKEISRVPRGYWYNQAIKLLNKRGWSEKGIDGLKRDELESYKGKRISGASLTKLRKKLREELTSRKS